jgi:hypothetical protein
VQVHYDEGVAIYIGPEPCVGVREDGDEARETASAPGDWLSRLNGRFKSVGNRTKYGPSLWFSDSRQGTLACDAGRFVTSKRTQTLQLATFHVA